MKYYYHFMSKNKVIDNQRVSKLSPILINGSENLKLNIAQYRTWIERWTEIILCHVCGDENQCMYFITNIQFPLYFYVFY